MCWSGCNLTNSTITYFVLHLSCPISLSTLGICPSYGLTRYALLSKRTYFIKKYLDSRLLIMSHFSCSLPIKLEVKASYYQKFNNHLSKVLTYLTNSKLILI